MPLPPHTADLLSHADTSLWDWPGDEMQVCEGSRFHSPTPMFVLSERFIPFVWNRSISDQHREERVWLCGTCQDNLRILQQIWWECRGDVPWEVRREFGNQIRALVVRAWDRYQSLMEDL